MLSIRSLFGSLLLPTLLAGGLATRAVLADEGEGGLLERLSAETANLAEQGRRHAAQLDVQGRTLPGVLVGSPARFVVALPQGWPIDWLPASGTLTAQDRAPATARLADADADLGLAIYVPDGPDLGGARLSLTAAALRRGALAFVADAHPPALVALPGPQGLMDDLLLPQPTPGGLLLAPGGGLLGVGHGGYLDAAAVEGCAACHLLPTPNRGAAAVLRLPGFSDGRQELRALAMDTPSGLLFCSLDSGKTWQRTHTSPGAVPTAATLTRYVPAMVMQRALEDVRASGRLARPYLGVILDEPAALAPLGSSLATDWQGSVYSTLLLPWRALFERPLGQPRLRLEPHRLPGPEVVPDASVRVARVVPDSPAARAEVGPGDLITHVDGRPVRDAAEFVRLLARKRPGEALTLTLSKQEQPVRVTLGDRQTEARSLVTAAVLGLDLQPLTAPLAAFLGLASDAPVQGVVVRAVQEGGEAAAADVQRGDVIVASSGTPIRDVGEFDALLGSSTGQVDLTLLRGAERLTLTLTLPSTGKGERAR